MMITHKNPIKITPPRPPFPQETPHCAWICSDLWICRLRPKQLRVVRAFKSTLEDLEDRRSIASLHSLRSSRSAQPIQGGHMSGTSPPQLTPQQRQILKQSVSAFYLQKSSSTPGAATVAPAAKLNYIDDEESVAGQGTRVAGGQLINLNEDLPKPVHETRI